ncbi:uncharacterized protein LOC131952812 isoform X2 [Physella acuta]|nr:uncharacterized protein LOC131952812 isoform X2 [Physella acuta]XP_059171655.1 uncharacterized protein LOC131952812 isoform X2 [Physella acuta]
MLVNESHYTDTGCCVEHETSASVPEVKYLNRSLVATPFAGGIVTPEVYEFYKEIFTWVKVVGQPLSVIFLVLSAAIFLSKSMRNPSTSFLVAWNLSEAYNVTMLTVFQVCSFGNMCATSVVYAYFKLWSTTYLGVACRRSLYSLNCLLAVQRFLVVAFPVKSKNLCLIASPLPVCITAVVISLLVHGYLPVKYGVASQNGTYTIVQTSLSLEHTHIFNAIASASMYVLVYLPLTVGALANIGMVVSLKRHMKLTQMVFPNRQDRRGREMQANAVVLTSTFLFFIFSLPSNINHLVSFHLDTYGVKKKEHYLFQTLDGAFVVCQVLSDVVIFLSYVCASTSFRRRLIHIIGQLTCNSCIKTTKSLEDFSKTSTSELSVTSELTSDQTTTRNTAIFRRIRQYLCVPNDVTTH